MASHRKIVHVSGHARPNRGRLEVAFIELLQVATAVLTATEEKLVFDEEWVRENVKLARGTEP